MRLNKRRLSRIDEIVLSLYARGLTTGDIAAHFAEIYGAQVSKDTISRITDGVVKEIRSNRTDPRHRRGPSVRMERGGGGIVAPQELTRAAGGLSGHGPSPATYRGLRVPETCGLAFQSRRSVDDGSRLRSPTESSADESTDQQPAIAQ